MDTFSVGDVILDKFEVTAVLGKGGMGVVLAARHRDLRELVALKFLLPALRTKPELCARFAREARTGIRIKNEHVARVYDVSSVDGVPFMVMEHLTGQDLAAVIRQRGPLPIAEIADLLLQACEPVNEAHALGIVHRDLKPGNLFLITAPDGLPFVKVLDFGISKTAAIDDISATATRDVLGSPLYMSPEQLASSRSVDARSDVWSLGVILYEMLAGVPPFAGDTFPTICAAILASQCAPLASHRADVPAALEQLASDALERDREKRLSSVEAFASRLAPFATDAGRASYVRIQRLASHAQAVATPLTETIAAPPSSPEVDPGHTRTGQSTAGEFAQSRATRELAPRSRMRTAIVGFAAVTAVGMLSLVIPRALRKTDAPVSPSASPSILEAARAQDQASGDCASGATPACESACAAKQPGRCEDLARALEHGTGAPPDLRRAKTLFEAACDGGSSSACNSLGTLYARGQGTEQDYTKAIELYTRACDQKYALACMNVGAEHFEGQGVPKNEALGTRFFLRGCEAGAPEGCLNVSIAYGEGHGVPKDAARSVAFAERACNGGVLTGCARLAMAKVLGDGRAKDLPDGLSQLDALCTKGEPTGCKSLAKLYATGISSDVPVDPLRVREYQTKACVLGDQRSCEAEKLLGTVDTSDSTMARANALFQTQCNSGSFAACGMLGENLVAGIGGNIDKEKGAALLKKACTGGFERACKRLGDGGPY